MTQTTAEEKPARALPRLDRDLLETLARTAGADDVGFTDIDAPGLGADRESLSRVLPWAGAILVFVRRLNRHAIRASLRNISSAEFQAGADDVKRTIHALERALEDRGIRAVGLSGLFPFAFGRADGPPNVVALKRLAEAAGLGVMGTNRMVLHPRFGADIYLGAVVLDGRVEPLDRRLSTSPCIGCNLCVVTCPTGAIGDDGRFDFGACMTHNYREKVGGFVEWVHTLADSRDRHDYRRRVSDVETLSWWQSLGYEANTHCDYCVAVCPAGDEETRFRADRRRHFVEVVQPLRERAESVHVVPGSDAEVHVAETFPKKTIRRIGSGRVPTSLSSFLAMMPLTFQRGRSDGIAARLHLRFHGAETLEATVEIRDRTISVERHLTGAADLVVEADAEAFLGWLRGERRLGRERLFRRIRLAGRAALLDDLKRCFPF